MSCRNGQKRRKARAASESARARPQGWLLTTISSERLGYESGTMILPTPPPSIRPQRTGDSDELPDYEAPSPIERARVAQEHKRRFGQGWPEDYKDPTGLQLHERAQRAATGETELAAFPASGFRASFGGSSRASLS